MSSHNIKPVTAIIQARMTSSRLPGKVLKEVLGRPMVSIMLERVQDSQYINKIVVATTTNPHDDPVAKLAEKLGYLVFRGSEHNVLNRFYLAAKNCNADTIMRLTADCPLIDPDLLDDLVVFFFDGQYDYASNCLEPTLPDGLDAEIFTFRALEDTFRNAVLPSHLEHVTPFIRENTDRFKIGSWRYHRDLSCHRWTVDQLEDFILVQQVFENLYSVNDKFRMNDIIKLIEEKPEIQKINTNIERNEGLLKSFEEDKKWFNSSTSDKKEYSSNDR